MADPTARPAPATAVALLAHWPKDQPTGPLRRHIAYVRQPAPQGRGGFAWRAAGNDRSVRKLTRNRFAPQGAGSGGLLVKERRIG